MSINLPGKRLRGYTLVELMVGVGVFALSGLGLATIFIFCVRSYAAMTNYAVLDQYNRQAMDQLTREIRQATAFVDSASNATMRSITITNGEGASVTYAFDATKQKLTRTVAGNAPQTLLTNCSLLNFNLYTRPPTSASFANYPVATDLPGWQKTVKVIQLTWKTALSICPTAQVNSEDVQTARIIIRKAQDTL